jgi:hypothetical protein
MEGPAIKGLAIENLVADLARYLEEKEALPEEIEARLEPDDLTLLREKVVASTWYPMDQYERLCRALYDLAGAGATVEEFQYERGIAAAERLIKAGVYAQLDHDDDEKTTREASLYDAKLRVSVIGAMLSCGKAHVDFDPDPPGLIRIEIREASGIPDLLAHTIAGFIGRCGEHIRGAGLTWHVERIEPDLLRFTPRAI